MMMAMPSYLPGSVFLAAVLCTFIMPKTDSVLNESGVIKYTTREDITIPFTFSNRKGAFMLEMNPAVFLSSNSEDYLPGKTMRGFRLTCSWGENQCEYGFITRTDATKD